MREAFDSAYTRIIVDGVEFDDGTLPYFFDGPRCWMRLRAGELRLQTFRGQVTGVDSTFPDADFTVRDDTGATREFVMHRNAGAISVGQQVIVRYVQFASPHPGPDGAVRLQTQVVEIWLN